MRYAHLLPHLPFDPGTVVFSPGVTAALQTFSLFREVIDHFLECHLATDFGVVSRATRFDNTLSALLGTGQLTSRYYLQGTISPPDRLVLSLLPIWISVPQLSVLLLRRSSLLKIALVFDQGYFLNHQNSIYLY